ncbi:MAG TPA: hypothetical protein VHH34_04675, partial [Pseudonocardiaceae bacterium]|nr:hypothetical protein [Pseudonocardiaceae bacterium]
GAAARLADPALAGLLVFHSLTASVLCLLLWYAGLKRAPASIAGVFTAFLPATAAAVAVALLVVLALVLGGYLIREVVRSAGPTPGSGTTVPPGPAAPVVTPEPEQPAPTAEEPEPEPEPTPEETATTEETAEEVVLNPFDYFGKPGDVAAERAEEQGLQPRVVDGEGAEVDPADQSQCRVTNMSPPVGSVPEGSTLELTCQEPGL